MNYDVIYGMLVEIQKKHELKKEITEDGGINLGDYLKILNKKEVKNYLSKKFENKDSIRQIELNKLKPELRKLLEIYCSENSIDIIDEEMDFDNSSLTAVKLFLNDISNYKLLTKDEEINLMKEIRENNNSEARAKFIYANLRLVVSIAKRYSGGNMENFMDAIGDGNEGLMKAVDKFSLEKECKFSTYATWWIEQSIRRGQANNSRTIRIPVHGYEKINKIRKIKNQYELANGVEPTDEYIAEQLGMDMDSYKQFVHLTTEVVSGDTVVSEDEHGDNSILFDFLADDNVNVEKIAMLHNLRDELTKKLDTLTEKEREVIKLRFGYDDDDPKTLEEVGHIYGVTRERIRQIEAKALKKLRNPQRSRYMKDYLS